MLPRPPPPSPDPALISYLFPSPPPHPLPRPTAYPLGPFDPAYSPAALIANTDRATAEQLGWIKSGGGAIQRYRTLRKLTSVQKEVEVLRRIRQGHRNVDIAVELGIASSTVSAIVKRSLKRAVVYAGAEKERDHQLEITQRVMERLMQRIDPGPGEDGYEPYVDTKAVAELMKVLNRRASLTGADQPTRVHLGGQIAHTISAADDTVDKVNTYLDLMDRVMDTGYVGRKRDGAVVDAEELDPADEDRIVDAEIVEEAVTEEPAEEPLHPFTPPLLHSVPNDLDPGGEHN